ncbi:PREDICTED: germinal-center associated nuclear protein-like [Gekko japonicus]|uniref:Germinal-center associated nuclear protein-like n=1 Tax=Gekko japonicus TaxID=146911 RepID=A0ABM1K2G3_GEKJA|nr:PREDICTED: germinal-center associated nuclear protein-like [Gekko japonicus]
MFKPIFGIGSEPEKTQSQTIPNPFTFSFSGESGSGRLAPFGISQETSSSSASTHFSFSKPVSSITTLSSSFPATLPSKTVEDDKKGPINPFANPSSSFGSFSFQSGLALARPSVLQKEEENKAKQEKKSSVSNPSRRNWNTKSTKSFGGLPPSELKSFLCKNIPDYLNDRRVLENHFKKFVKIHYIDVNRSKKRAIVHCLDHSSGVLARKKAKLLHKEIVTFWQKKPKPTFKSCPGYGQKGRKRIEKQFSILKASEKRFEHGNLVERYFTRVTSKKQNGCRNYFY